MKVYISGAISSISYDEANVNFTDAEAYLEAKGFEVLNPMDNGLSSDATYEEHMKRDLEMLLECDAIYMLHNWRESKGATCERHVAKCCGILIISQEL